MAFDATLLVKLSASLTSALDLQTASAPLSFSRQLRFTEGAGADQADKVWTDERTLAASANEDLDLAGSLTDPFGATITLARVKGLLVYADADNTNNVLVGGAATNTFINWVSDATDQVVVRPGGLLALFTPDATGYAVTADTGDLLRIANSGAGSAVTYQVAVIGAAS